MFREMKTIGVVLIFAAVAAAQEMQATVKMMPNDETSNVTGILKLVQSAPDAPVIITGTLNGLKAGKHGFHVHEKGDLSDSCTSTKSHFNPAKKAHGAPEDTERHVGDLGNVEANSQGIVNVHISDKMISLTGPNSILGRAIVIHSDIDDLGKGGHPLSGTTGNAGSRLACGVIGVASPVGSWPSSSSRAFIIAPFLLLMSIFSTFFVHQSGIFQVL